MAAPMSQAALIISTTMPDGPGALPAFICEIAFLTISMVIGMGGLSTGDWYDRWSGSQSNSNVHILPQVFPVFLKHLSKQRGNKVEYGRLFEANIPIHARA